MMLYSLSLLKFGVNFLKQFETAKTLLKYLISGIISYWHLYQVL